MQVVAKQSESNTQRRLQEYLMSDLSSQINAMIDRFERETAQMTWEKKERFREVAEDLCAAYDELVFSIPHQKECNIKTRKCPGKGCDCAFGRLSGGITDMRKILDEK